MELEFELSLDCFLSEIYLLFKTDELLIFVFVWVGCVGGLPKLAWYGYEEYFIESDWLNLAFISWEVYPGYM